MQKHFAVVFRGDMHYNKLISVYWIELFIVRNYGRQNQKIVLARQRADRFRAIPMAAGDTLPLPSYIRTNRLRSGGASVFFCF